MSGKRTVSIACFVIFIAVAIIISVMHLLNDGEECVKSIVVALTYDIREDGEYDRYRVAHFMINPLPGRKISIIYGSNEVSKKSNDEYTDEIPLSWFEVTADNNIREIATLSRIINKYILAERTYSLMDSSDQVLSNASIYYLEIYGYTDAGRTFQHSWHFTNNVTMMMEEAISGLLKTTAPPSFPIRLGCEPPNIEIYQF
jgi:hypothetical protein